MSSYFFHKGSEAGEFIAPAPDEYAELTVERALWQSFGRRADEMTMEEFSMKTALLRVESQEAEKKRN